MTALFLSYSHKDEELQKEVVAHLSMLRNEGLITTWHDRSIKAGEEFDKVISEELNRADIILLLISSDFLYSKYCFSTEMMRAMERHNSGQAHVIPIILRSCDWHSAPFAKLIAAPRDGKPVMSWSDKDEALTDVAKKVREVVVGFGLKKGEHDQVGKIAAMNHLPEIFQQVHGVPIKTPPIVGGLASSPSTVSSSPGLLAAFARPAKSFSDFDKDQFLLSAYSFILEYFQSAVANTCSNDSVLQGRVEVVNARGFEAVVYRSGNVVARCSIRINKAISTNGITYSQGFWSENSFNELLTVDTTGQELSLKTLGMQFSSKNRNAALSQLEGAELFWELFVQQVNGSRG